MRDQGVRRKPAAGAEQIGRCDKTLPMTVADGEPGSECRGDGRQFGPGVLATRLPTTVPRSRMTGLATQLSASLKPQTSSRTTGESRACSCLTSAPMRM